MSEGLCECSRDSSCLSLLRSRTFCSSAAYTLCTIHSIITCLRVLQGLHAVDRVHTGIGRPLVLVGSWIEGGTTAAYSCIHQHQSCFCA